MPKVVIGCTLTLAVSVLVTLAVVYLLRPQVRQVQGAFQYISDNWPK
jgi:hypothetical protein